MSLPSRTLFSVREYDLAATLASGQAFRWRQSGDAWRAVVGGKWVQLRPMAEGIEAATASPCNDWVWLENYLQIQVEFQSVAALFPADEPMREAVRACRGLRLLRQAPWECLASFILSSTKQITQIQQIIENLCGKFGDKVKALDARGSDYSFPQPERLASASEAELRACKAGFRAPYLRETARRVASGEVDLRALAAMPVETARNQLLALPGVGRKIADCVLLFAYGFQEAFPLDVWVMKALRELYFQGRPAPIKTLQKFSASYFGPCGGYAQQYLFHYMRTKLPRRRPENARAGISLVV
jgi:N-glycosylase/DNA lyase